MIGGTNVFGRREGVVVQQVEGDSVLMDIDSGGYFTLNPVGSLVWEQCDGTRTVAEIAEAVSVEYDADTDTVRTDVAELFEALADAGLVVAH